MDQSWRRLALWVFVAIATIWVLGRLSTLVGVYLVLLLPFVVYFMLSNVLVPLILGRMTHTHPLAIIVALLVLGQLFGLIGMFFAVPAVVIVREILAWWHPEVAS